MQRHINETTFCLLLSTHMQWATHTLTQSHETAVIHVSSWLKQSTLLQVLRATMSRLTKLSAHCCAHRCMTSESDDAATQSGWTHTLITITIKIACVVSNFFIFISDISACHTGAGSSRGSCCYLIGGTPARDPINLTRWGSGTLPICCRRND